MKAERTEGESWDGVKESGEGPERGGGEWEVTLSGNKVI